MARQFRSDDTSKWPYGFGSGGLGNYSSAGSGTIGGTQNAYYATFAGTSGNTTGTLGTSWTWNAPVLIHQTRGTGVGNWELNWLIVTASTSATFALPLQNTYTTSGASAAQIITVGQYNDFTIGSGHTLTVPAWAGSTGGIAVFMAKGTLTVTGSISASSLGFVKGGAGTGAGNETGLQGEGSSGTGIRNVNANGNSGGGGLHNSADGGGGGGGGGNSSSGSNGTGPGYGGASSGNAGLTSMLFGGAGGGGGSDDSAGYPGREGGNGGGIVILIGKTISYSGSTVANGQNGTSAGSVYRGAGGGGAGGCILLKCQTATLGTNLLTATAGSGGTGDKSGNGGAGSTGRIHLDYKTSYSGTTNPTIDARQDLSLDYPPQGAFLLNFI